LWWDGYDPANHDTIIFDEFTGWIPFNIFKILCDNSPYEVQFKGGFKHFRPKKIIFTSNKHPYTWYKSLTEIDKVAFKRRIDEIKYFDQVYNECDKEPIDNTPQHILNQIKEDAERAEYIERTGSDNYAPSLRFNPNDFSI